MKKVKIYLGSTMLAVLMSILIFSFNACTENIDLGELEIIGDELYTAYTEPITYSPQNADVTLNGGISMPWNYQKGGSDYGNVIEYGFIITSNKKYSIYYPVVPFKTGEEKEGNIGKSKFHLGEHKEFIITVKDKISIKLLDDGLTFNTVLKAGDTLYESLKDNFKDADADVYYIAYVISKTEHNAAISLGSSIVFSKDLL